jgi:hypothetical protein
MKILSFNFRQSASNPRISQFSEVHNGCFAGGGVLHRNVRSADCDTPPPSRCPLCTDHMTAGKICSNEMLKGS